MKEENRKPILSISLLCSGKSKTETIKCLDSLKTIRDRLSSEIIIVDTGCNKEIRTLIEEYADLVVEFSWCDDFAKARNFGLKKCTGEWFLFVDDDEWFENTDDIVDFFKRGEYKNYGSARYVIRNYMDLQGNTWEELWVGRLTRLTPNLCFEGKIHEYYSQVYTPVKWLRSYAHHYGYVYKSLDDKYIKAKRNITPLLEMLKEEPDNLHWRTQLVQEYEALSDYSRLYDLCTDTIKKIEKLETPLVNRDHTDFYAGRMIADNGMHQYQDTIKDFYKFSRDRRNNSACMAFLYYIVSIAYYRIEDYHNTRVYAEKYMQIFDKWQTYNDFNDRLAAEASFTCRDIFSDRIVQQNLSRLIHSEVKTNDMKGLDKYIDRVDWQKCNNDTISMICESLTEAFEKNNFDEKFVDYANSMLSNDRPRDTAIFFAKKAEKTGGDDHSYKMNHLISVYGRTTGCNDWYILYMKLRFYDLVNDEDKLNEEYHTLLNNVVDIFNLNKSVWDIAEKRKIDLASIFKDISFESWKSATDNFISEHSLNRIGTMKQLLGFIAADEDVRFNYFRLRTEEALLIKRFIKDDTVKTSEHIRPGYEEEDKKALEEAKKTASKDGANDQIDYGDLCDELESYCNDCVAFYQYIYTPEWFTGDMTILPPQCRFAIHFLEAIDIDNKINSSDRIKELEKCVDIYAPFNPALGEYIKEYGSKEKERLLRIQNNPELEKVYQMLDLLKQAIELQEKTGSKELQAGIMQQRQLVESMLTSIIGDVSIDSEADNSCWILSVKELIENNGK